MCWGRGKGFLLIMVWWSLACASHGLAATFGMLAASRFLLGMGEGGGFPAATKAVAEWFPARERSTAMGIINAGTAVGAVFAPPLIAYTLAAELAMGLLPFGRESVCCGPCGGCAPISRPLRMRGSADRERRRSPRCCTARQGRAEHSAGCDCSAIARCGAW